MKLPIQNNFIHSYRYLPYIVAIYSFFFLLPTILLKKRINLPCIGSIPISILFTGIYFMLLDVVTEVYGYYEARRVLIAGLIAYSLFVLIMTLINLIPPVQNSSIKWGGIQDPNAYLYLFKGIHFVWFSVVICALTANTLNIITLSKWKILTHGKYFWIRSITTSLISAIIYSFISNFFAFALFLNGEHWLYFLELTTISVSSKLITLLICAYPSTMLCYFLKHKEGVNIYDYNVTYNPFKSVPSHKDSSHD